LLIQFYHLERKPIPIAYFVSGRERRAWKWGKGIKIPIARISQETTGKTITANTVALGVLVGLTRLVSRESIEKAVTARAPKGTQDMNRRALQAGFSAADQVRATV
jgi:Pyruvate/2-oxoacid:ferredoxin oxidoreductase gamma subunit